MVAVGRDAGAAGGLTNLNYRIGDFVLRLPGAGTSEYIDRHAEEVAARSASDAGVNAELLHFDAGDGLMVTRFVDGAPDDVGGRFRRRPRRRRARRARLAPTAHDGGAVRRSSSGCST